MTLLLSGTAVLAVPAMAAPPAATTSPTTATTSQPTSNAPATAAAPAAGATSGATSNSPASTTAAAAGGSTQTAAASGSVAVGATVKDTQGGTVGTIESVDGQYAVLATTKNKVRLPLSSFGMGADGPILAMTQAEVDAAAASAAAKTATP
jgi:hypothetical protein